MANTNTHTHTHMFLPYQWVGPGPRSCHWWRSPCSVFGTSKNQRPVPSPPLSSAPPRCPAAAPPRCRQTQRACWATGENSWRQMLKLSLSSGRWDPWTSSTRNPAWQEWDNNHEGQHFVLLYIHLWIQRRTVLLMGTLGRFEHESFLTLV